MDRDQTEITGWTGKDGDGVAKYHQQFWSFRGYVFFNAQDSVLLPWNTTKTGIDPDSSDYIAVRMKMIEMMKDVFVLLNKQKIEREKGNPEKNRILNNTIRKVVSVPILQIIQKKKELPKKFKFPAVTNPVKVKDIQTITYSIPMVKFNRAKSELDASSPADVGSKTFDYYYQDVIGD